MKFSCPHCQQPLEADDSLIGAATQCPTCGNAFVIQADPSAEPPQPEEMSEIALESPVSEAETAQESVSVPETEILPPPPPSPPAPSKTAPHFRVVSHAAPHAETTPSGSPATFKAAPKFRVVSRSVPTGQPGATPTSASATGGAVAKGATVLRDRFNDFTGLEKIEGFSLSDLLSEIFGKHKAEDIEEFFTVGTSQATPPIEQVDTSWPKPWLFFRALAASILLYLAFAGAYDYFGNDNLIPGMMLMGTLAVPFSTLLFFYEVNVRRNISLYQVIRLFFLGGILSLMISLVFFQVHDKLPGASSSETIAMAWVGPIEETGKLLALLMAARSMRYHYKLNGLLMGAAIGTGFAVFESMGYALKFMLFALLDVVQGASVDPVEVMKNVIFVRGVLSPLGHVVWTAIAGAALWRVKGAEPFRVGMLANGKFWHLFLVPVILHSIWDMNIPFLDGLPYNAKYLLLGFAAWFVAIALVQEGLKELRAEKTTALAQAAGAEEVGNPEAEKNSAGI